jgi:hypothetical protein
MSSTPDAPLAESPEARRECTGAADAAKAPELAALTTEPTPCTARRPPAGTNKDGRKTD